MGQVLDTLSAGNQEEKLKEFGPLIEECYGKYIGVVSSTEELTSADFYHAVCQTTEKLNEKLGSSQFRVPQAETLEKAYQKHHKGKGKTLTKEEFEEIVKALIVDTTALTGFGAKDTIFYMFGVPATALFIKQRIAPNAIRNDIFIPVVTSATVFLLAKLNKI